MSLPAFSDRADVARVLDILVSAPEAAVAEAGSRQASGPSAITATLEAGLGDVDEALRTVFALLGPGTGTRDAVVQFEVRVSDGVRPYWVRFGEDQGSAVPGRADHPTLVYGVELADLLLLVCGRLGAR